MITLRQGLYSAALLGALALLLWGSYQRIEVEQGRTNLVQEKLDTVNARVERDATTITTLDVRKQQIKELKRENAELREWAAAQLPAAARRLRQRPAITGADAYRDWLSGRNALHPERD
jgi:hypothetical protein